MISEKIELLGRGLYKNIPGTLTLKSIPTSSELDYVGSEDFNKTMIEQILPKSVEEQIDFKELLEIDFQWICRCLRILNYGPYHTTNAIYCTDCDRISRGEYQVDLRSIDCSMLPQGFVNDICVSKDDFIDYNKDIHFKLLTIREAMDAYEDSAFLRPDGSQDRTLARMCYMITSIGNKDKMNPVETKLVLQNNLSSADYIMLKDAMNNLSEYGLHVSGTAQCPKCGSKKARFFALVDDRFFRPTVGNLRRWKLDRNSGQDANAAGSPTKAV